MRKVNFILKALDFSAFKHRYQRRKGDKNLPYINHPIKVAYIVSEIGKVEDPIIIASAVLHDVVEDTETSFDELRKEFGDRVASIVMEDTDNKSLEKSERKRLQIENAKDLSYEATIVRIADKIANIMDIVNSPPNTWAHKRKNDYLEWAESVVSKCKDYDDSVKSLKKYFFMKLKYVRKILNEHN